MPRYNFLDEAGLKQYHKLAGYSEIPLEYTSGKKLNTSNGEAVTDTSGLEYCVTDYIGLPVDAPYYLKTAASSSAICFYDENNNFLSGKTLSGRKYKLVLNTENTKAVKFRVSFQYTPQDVPINGDVDIIYQVSIRALHDSTTKWLYDKINTEITETNNTIVRLHADYGISATSTTTNPFEIGVSTPITISKAYFKFDNANVTPSGGYEITRSGNAGSKTLFSGSSGGILNTSGSISDAITNSATYTISITHLGGTFTKSASVSAYYPMYFGSSAKESIVSSDLNSIISNVTNNPTNNGTDSIAVAVAGVGVFTKQKIWNSPTGAHAFKVNNDEFVYLLVPSTMSISMEGVKSGGFKVPLSPTVNTITSTNKGSYKVYRSDSTFNGGILNITIGS